MTSTRPPPRATRASDLLRKLRAPRRLSLGARFGVWVGLFGWFIGFFAATAGHYGSFLPHLVGGFAVSLACGLLTEAIVKWVPRFPLGIVAAVCISIGLIGAYHTLVVHPAILGYPDVMRKIGVLRGESRFPLWLAAAAFALGLVLLAVASRPPRQPAPS